MKIVTLTSVVTFVLLSFALGTHPAAASMHTFCPGGNQLYGWWGSFTPTNRLCATDYYTWNTNSGLGGEESWYLGNPHYIACNYSSFQNPGNVASKVYIPSPDANQTNNHAHYYKWFNSGNYLMIGQVPQYSVFGYYSLATVDWSQYDRLKLSDWTHDATEYSKRVDIDAYQLDCYFN